ncbi:hypothetical protein J6590_100361 [Homalodisca vitripennis]|nr:hypothetical protein J6590_100361 [Homalodisca vitripennis]
MTESVLVGNFNLPNVDWSILVNTIDSSSVRLRKELASLLRGNQCNGVKNNHLVLLDLVFSSIPDTDVVEDCQLLVNIDHQHPALNVRVPVPQLNYPSASLLPNLRRCEMANTFLDLQSLGFHEMDYRKSTVELSIESDSGKILAHTPMKKIGCRPGMIEITNVLKYRSPVLTGLIHKLFSKSLQSVVFLEALKQSYIVLIHKGGGAVDNVCDYRPITIQPTLANVFKNLVLKKVDQILTKRIVPQQHGLFMADRPPPT